MTRAMLGRAALVAALVATGAGPAAGQGDIHRLDQLRLAPATPLGGFPRASLELVGGWGGGVLLGIGAYRLAQSIADDRTVKGDAGYSPAGNVGFVVGATVGVAAGVTLTRALLGGEPTFGRALLGAAIPGALMLLWIDDPYMPLVAVAAVSPLQAIIARR